MENYCNITVHLLSLTKLMHVLEFREEPNSSAEGEMEQKFDNAEKGKQNLLYYTGGHLLKKFCCFHENNCVWIIRPH